MKTKLYKNGTPYPDSAWKRWYGIKSSSEAQEEHERILREQQTDADIDQAIESKYHSHTDRR